MSNYIHTWEIASPRGVILIAHGMSEHGARYDHFASVLNAAGYAVYAPDHRGHGRTAGDLDNVGFFAESNGWNWVVEDFIGVAKMMKEKYPTIPLILLGHSMGSFIVRSAQIRKPELADYIILSGTAGHPGLKGSGGKILARLMRTILGKKKRSAFLTKLSFAGFNKRVDQPTTERDWLSRDHMQVEKYINDPFCMQTFSIQFFYDLATGVLEVNNAQNFKQLKKDKPHLLIAGSMDPVGNYGKGPLEVAQSMRNAGLTNVEMKLFEGARHEILNEINREEVYTFILNWLSKTGGKTQ